MTSTLVSVRNRRISEEAFLRKRADVLRKWPTGAELQDLAAIVNYLQQLPPEKNTLLKIKDAKEKGYVCTQPRGGVPLLDKMIALHQRLETEGDADILLPVTTDSYTRSEQFERTEEGLQASLREGRSLLNGFPTVNHGLGNCRRLQESTKSPIFALGGNPLNFLNAEMTFAAGFCGLIGSGICTPVGYSKYVTIEQGIANYQYVDRLAAYYQERGIPLYREATGFLTWILVPCGMEIALNILDCLLAAEQGVKYYGLAHSSQLNLLQDTAAVQVGQEVCREYLNRFGFTDVETFVTLHSYGGSFPSAEGRAYGTIAMISAIAGLAGVQGVTVKTVDEAKSIPTLEHNVEAVRAARQTLNIIGKNRYPDHADLRQEKSILVEEVRAIINRVLEIGEGDVAAGAVKGFAAGILDCPWSPNLALKGRLIGMRDHRGLVRIYSAGNVPVPLEIMEYHQEQLAQRAARQKQPLGYEMIMNDMLAVANGSCLSY